jgi:hypothetical protein
MSKAEASRQFRRLKSSIRELRFGGTFLGLWLICHFSFAGPVQHPKRSVNSYTIDLTPLFTWWTNHDGRRPLSAWTHIIGSISGTNAGAWILDARVERVGPNAGDDKDKSPSSSSSTKILLQNPPVEDLVQFEQVSARLNELNTQRAELLSRENQARMREQAVARQQRANPRNVVETRVLALEDKQLKQAESVARAQQTSIDQQLGQLKAKLSSYPSIYQYELDCFALDLHHDFNGFAIYDYGRVLK